jgi:pyruvate/2-oxoglutarate dehydrogenase complex dihydrolipoamide acyltransferase (E2) component
MAVDVLLPVVSAAGDDGVVTAWMVDEGARVKAGQLIAEMQAEKVATDVYAPADGVVRGLVAVMEAVPQGGVICRIEEPKEGAAEPAPPAPEPGRPMASPAARRVAAELGIDLTRLTGTGPGGRITEGDVRAAAAAPGAGGPDGIRLSGLRATIARNMRASHAGTAPVTITTTADVTDTVPPQITAWVVRAAALSLLKHPHLNGTADGDTFYPSTTCHVSLAIQTDDGLVAPVVRDPARRSTAEVASMIAELAERARSRRLAATDYEGGTFSVTNLGPQGIDAFTPIINPPQVAVLGVGTVRRVAGFDSYGSVAPREQMVLSLTFDHSFVDGAPAAAFLADLRERLESPEQGTLPT